MQKSYRTNENKSPTDDKCFAFDTTPFNVTFFCYYTDYIKNSVETAGEIFKYYNNYIWIFLFSVGL